MFFPCFLYDRMKVDNLISGSSAFSKLSLYIWKFLVHILLKPSLKDFEPNLISMWNEGNCAVVWAFFSIALFWIGMKTGKPSYLSLLCTAYITNSLKAELPEAHLSTCVWVHTCRARWGSLNRPAWNLFVVRSRFLDSSLFSHLHSVERSLLFCVSSPPCNLQSPSSV